MVSGTYILTDTIKSAFSTVLLSQVQALPGVAQASSGISDRVQLIGHDGKVISRGGAPDLAFSHDPSGERFNPLTLIRGTWPTGPDQVAIDASTASKEG